MPNLGSLTRPSLQILGKTETGVFPISDFPQIRVKTNLHIMKFLDNTLDLRNNTYEPYSKPGNYPVCINESSNHPKTILRELPKSIYKRPSNL